jgi:hypothetical protein
VGLPWRHPVGQGIRGIDVLPDHLWVYFRELPDCVTGMHVRKSASIYFRKLPEDAPGCVPLCVPVCSLRSRDWPQSHPRPRRNPDFPSTFTTGQAQRAGTMHVGEYRMIDDLQDDHLVKINQIIRVTR